MSKQKKIEYSKPKQPKPYQRTKMRQDTREAVDCLRTQRKVVTR